MKKLLVLVVLAVFALQTFADDKIVPLWAELDPGTRIASVMITTETDMESASRSVKEDDGTYSVALISDMVNLMPLTQDGSPYMCGGFGVNLNGLKCTQDELIAAGLACDPQITWLGSYGDDKATVIKRAMVTIVATKLKCPEEIKEAWVEQVMAALDGE